MEGFQDVILVSQSYRGIAATGTLARIPDRIRSMIYLDAFVPEYGESLIDCYSLERKAQFMIYKDEDRPIPPLPLSYLGITDPALVEFMTPRLVNRNRFSSYLSHSRNAIDRIYDASHCY
jgi:pimeloyl-ACP methyl ester carboxylesterase